MKTPAQGPYEIVIIQDEEGKARGKNGEQWIMIRNADGAIATVYPAKEAEATARLLAASWELLEFAQAVSAVIDNLKLGGEQFRFMTALEPLARAIIAQAEGRDGAPSSPGRTEPITPEPQMPWEAKES